MAPSRERNVTQSTIPSHDIWKIADELHLAEQSRVPIEPLTDAHPHLSIADAYRIQRANAERRIAMGQRVVGHKIGLTAKAMQEQFNVSVPDYGHLLAPMIHDARAPLDLSELIDPMIEVEPAFVLSTRLQGPGVTMDDVLEATDYISVCFEVIDSRIVDWRIKLQDTVADNGSSARVIVGSKKVRPADIAALNDLDSVFEMDGRVMAEGNTSAILGHPANGIAWLANALSGFNLALEAGDIVLPGTCTRSHRIGGHKHVRGAIDEIGEVELDLANLPSITKYL
jgi:2-keto-4-pentenoate hydratase